ncbi:fungal-specific transcription factor domain-containing protein [Xylaria arbuscula]|nr:fungal-specific transcription factor domain-containing protein [Xylaria arbuscula]
MVMQLARLSAEKSKATSMRYVKFDDAVISEIEKALESWQHESPPTSLQDEASLHEDMDTMHCSEAWRNGLLLYLYRVFRWEPGEPVSIQATLRARILTDHIFACREDGLVTKQALLPLFFGGCELRDEPTRKKIVRYCAIWDDMTRYHMFNSTIPLLKEVWADQEQKGFDNVWWGQVVDRRHAAESRDALQMRICFG